MKAIEKFWTWFQDNEQEVKNALVLGIRTEEVLPQLSKKVYFVSRRIGFVIKFPATDADSFLFIFTGGGYRKLFPKLLAFEELAPQLEFFRVQAFIKPMENREEVLLGTDRPIYFRHYEFKVSILRFSLLDFSVKSKQVRLTVFLEDYHALKGFEQLLNDVETVLIDVIGEIKYRKHIKDFELAPLPINQSGLIPLIELEECIDYLYTINSRKKTRVI